MNLIKKLKDDAEALNLINSTRGQFLISKAIMKGIEVMESEKHPPTSDIRDLKFILHTLYKPFEKLHKLKLKEER